MACARKCNDCVECLSALPDGKTCSDCANVRRCLAFGFTKATNTFCDFYPSRAAMRAPALTTEAV